MTSGEGETYVVDIETVGEPWSSIDDKTQTYLQQRARTEEERESVPRRLGLSPGTGRIIVIGMLNVTAGEKGGMFVEGRGEAWTEDGPEGFLRYKGDERALLTEFWRILGSNRNNRVVTFNGRMFDGPYMMIRSAMLGVQPSLNLVGYRYKFQPHCDLAEVLNFHGVLRTNYSLDYWCRRFGITSPKEEGLDGSMVQEFYESGRLDEIVDYCARDVVATGELYARLKDTLIPALEGPPRW